jgi:hypothetical protein
MDQDSSSLKFRMFILDVLHNQKIRLSMVSIKVHLYPYISLSEYYIK